MDGKDAKKARKALNDAYDGYVKARGPIGLQLRREQRPSIVEEESARQQAHNDARAAGSDFDIGSFDAGPMIEAGASMGEIARARQAAREAGNYREGDFDPATMPDKIIVSRPNIDPFMDDPESYRLLAIEKYDSETDTATKTRVFTENAVRISSTPKINSPEDALLHLLGETGRVEASQYEQAKAMSTADPRVLQLTELRAERDKLSRRAGAAMRQRRQMEANMNAPWPGAYHLVRQSALGVELDSMLSIKATVPGSATEWRWTHPLETPYDARLDIGLYDALVVTERGLDGTGVADPRIPAQREQGLLDLTYEYLFYENALLNGRLGLQTPVFLYSTWFPLVGQGDWRAGTLLAGERFAYRADWLSWKLRQRFPTLLPTWQVWMIPSHLMLVRIYDDILADAYPGGADWSAQFADDIHPANDGLIPTALAYLAVTIMHGTDLRGNAAIWKHESVSADQAEYLKARAWEIATSYGRCGMGGVNQIDAGFNPLTDTDPLPVITPPDEGGGGDPPDGGGGETPTVEVPAALLVMDAAGYSGPELGGTQPVVADGIMHFQEGGLWALDAPLADGMYCCCAVRRAAYAAAFPTIISACSNASGWGDRPSISLFLSGETDLYARVHLVDSDWPEGVLIGRTEPAVWQIIEFWAFGTTIGGRVGAGADRTGVLPQPTTATEGLRLFCELDQEVVGIRIMGTMPTTEQRVSIRDWMRQRITLGGGA